MADYLLAVAITTLLHLFLLMGPATVFGMVVNWLSKRIVKNAVKLIGIRAYLWLFGWLGTSLHELGHYLFAKLFGHKIKRVKWFSLQPNTAQLGYVEHAYNPKNIYHNIGNFFIGMGPLLLSALLLYGLLWGLFGLQAHNQPNMQPSTAMLAQPNLLWVLVQNAWYNTGQLIAQLLPINQFAWWRWAIFIYVLFAMGSAVALSPADLKGALSGFKYVLLIMLLFNLLSLWHSNFATFYIQGIANQLTLFNLLLFVLLLCNVLFWFVLKILRVVFT